MFRPVLLISFLISAIIFGQQNSSKASKKTLKLQTEIYNLIKKKALYSDSLDWKKIDAELTKLPLTENDSVSQKILFDYYLDQLKAAGDNHSFFITKSIMEERGQQPLIVKPEGKYLGNGIAMIKVPACSNYDNQKDLVFAETIRSEIKRLDSENTVTGWIVDLRNNMGGNMWPMVAGLNALTEDGIVGYFVAPNYKSPWLTRNGRMVGSKAKISDYKIKNPNLKIAVLINEYTASSGEMTALSLIGLPNVKTFGKDSMGYITANGTFTLSNGANFNLATSTSADRTGKVYTDKIRPDVYVENLKTTPEDEVIEEAEKWLMIK
ncbi:S41 family peptidase [Chryseobacterium foetidum]|uniref:S41 family peptidase n=1 Tax=Chryseobacterium foetidum TaxID=2951057 RepID=UPI0021C9F84E|nr:S41 family peptidase [Chryseobacterium foetidum]